MRIFGAVLLSVLTTGSALAYTCPDVSEIRSVGLTTDSEMGLKGYGYSAENRDGKWLGFTPILNEKKPNPEPDLKSLKFHSSDDSDGEVACRYEDANGESINFTH